jgi:hypothetical protein
MELPPDRGWGWPPLYFALIRRSVASLRVKSRGVPNGLNPLGISNALGPQGPGKRALPIKLRIQ